MAIWTQESLSGFIASDPELRETSKLCTDQKGAPPAREDDGTFTQIKTTFHHLVMPGHSAEHADEQIAKRDNFTAEVCTRMVHYEYDSG